MSEELQSLVQIMELYGRGLGGLGKAIRFSAKGAAKGVDLAKVKTMQHKMKLHYASTGEHHTMRLKDLEKLTGNQYNILNIPLEDEKDLIKFYDRLKKMHVSFAELPDLQMGDGYTQIAYNPMDAENVKMVVQYYRNKFGKESQDISIEDYIKTGGKEEEELLNELAQKGYTNEMHVEQLAEIQTKMKDENYIPISINIESLLVKENKDSYVFRVPRGRTQSKTNYAILVKKSDVLLLDKGQTVITTLESKGAMNRWEMDAKGNVDFNKPESVSLSNLAEAFAPVEKDKLRQIERLQPNYTDVFPSFNQGQENQEQSLAPSSVLEEKFTKNQEQMGKILSMEEFKMRQRNPEYVPISFDRETQIVAENQNVYAASLPKDQKEQGNLIRCMVIDKADVKLSEDGQRLSAYVKKAELSKIMEFDGGGKKLREYKMKNEEIAIANLKAERSGNRSGRIHDMEPIINDIGKKVIDATTGKKVL